MKNVFIILSSTETVGFYTYEGIVTEVTNNLIKEYTGHNIDEVSKHETEKGIYFGYVCDDPDTISEFNSYIAKCDYSTAYQYCTDKAIFLKRESI